MIQGLWLGGVCVCVWISLWLDFRSREEVSVPSKGAGTQARGRPWRAWWSTGRSIGTVEGNEEPIFCRWWLSLKVKPIKERIPQLEAFSLKWCPELTSCVRSLNLLQRGQSMTTHSLEVRKWLPPGKGAIFWVLLVGAEGWPLLLIANYRSLFSKFPFTLTLASAFLFSVISCGMGNQTAKVPFWSHTSCVAMSNLLNPSVLNYPSIKWT